MSTLTIDVNDAQNQLRDLLAMALKGEEVIIADDDKPVARLVPVETPEAAITTPKKLDVSKFEADRVVETHKAATTAPKKKRIAGLNRGQIWVSEDFDDELPDEFWLGEDEALP